MSPHSEDGALIGNYPEQSQSVRNMVAEQSATPVLENQSAVHSHKFEKKRKKKGRSCGRSAAHKKTCGPYEAHRVHCPTELDGDRAPL